MRNVTKTETGSRFATALPPSWRSTWRHNSATYCHRTILWWMYISKRTNL